MSDTKIPKTFVDRWNAAAADKTVTSAELAELRTVAKTTPETEDDAFLAKVDSLRSLQSTGTRDIASLAQEIPQSAKDSGMIIDGVTIEYVKSAQGSDTCSFTTTSTALGTLCNSDLNGTIRNTGSLVVTIGSGDNTSDQYAELTPTKPKIDWQKLGYLYTGWSRANEGSAHSHGIHYDLSITHPRIAAPFITPALRLDAELAIGSPALSLAAGPGLRIGVPVFCEGYAHVMGSAHILRADGETSKGFSMYSVLGVQALYFYGEGMFPVSGSDSLSRGKGFSLGVRSAF